MTIAFALWLVIVVVFDFLERRVPNWLVVGGVALAMTALALGLNPVPIQWADSLAAGAIAFTVMLLFYVMGLMGAGDVKFAGALGLWMGLHNLLPLWITSSLLAALHGLLWLVLKRWPVWPSLFLMLSGPEKAATTSTAGPMQAFVEHATPRLQRHIPYAAYLAVSALICLGAPLPPV